jgi:hypothetical protein
MSLPVIAVTNVSACLKDEQVEEVLPALQRQVSEDFKSYWDLDCALTFVAKGQAPVAGWWQLVIMDDPIRRGCWGITR